MVGSDGVSGDAVAVKAGQAALVALGLEMVVMVLWWVL